MNTIGDIRARFENALNENARTIEGTILPPLEKILGAGRINSKNGGKDLRFDLGGVEQKTTKSISSALNAIGLNQFNISVIGAGDYGNGANSGKFTTYLVLFTKDSTISSINIKKGETTKGFYQI